MVTWFPLPRSLMESATFMMCTPAEKVFFLHIASEVNLRRTFYRADLEEAVTLHLSEDKTRRSRRKFMQFGWLRAKPGFRAGGRRLATHYYAVPGADRSDGDFFARFPRFTFETLLDYLRHDRITHADVVVHAYLTYFRARSGDGDSFFISKNELCDLTGLPSAIPCVSRLQKVCRLFEFKEEYHRLVFFNWVILPDPSECEMSAEQAERHRREITTEVEARKRLRSADPPEGGPSLQPTEEVIHRGTPAP